MGEPSWHRRARRQRGDARALVRVAAAGRLLQLHHSAQNHGRLERAAMPNGGIRGKGAANSGGKGGKGGGAGGKGGGGGSTSESPQWDCHICGLPGNFGWRLRCRGCDAIRRFKAANAAAATTAAGEINKGGQPPQSLAERQLRQAREEHRKQRAAAEEENRQLREALARLRTGTAERGKKGSEEDDDEGDGEEDELDQAACPYSSWTEEERQRRLEEARGALAYFISKFGEESEQANSTREEIAAVQRASRGAKPFKAHRGLLERKLERLREKQRRDESEIDKVSAELETLENKRKALRTAVEDRSKQIADAEVELAELVKKALAEGAAAGDAGRGDEDGGATWSAQAATVTLQNMASRPGVPPEFAALLEHVFRAAQALANAASTTQPATAAAAAASSASSAKAEGSASSGHRNGVQQQQSQQQRQPQHPTAAAAPGKGTGKAAAEGGGKGSLSGAAVGPLVPQGRWGREAGGGAGGGSRDQQQPHSDDADAMLVDAAGAAEGGAAADNGANQEEGSEELLEEEAIGSGIDEAVTASINKLPMADQRKLKAALGARGGRRGAPTEAEENEKKEDAASGRDRERSPRPTKGGAGQDSS